MNFHVYINHVQICLYMTFLKFVKKKSNKLANYLIKNYEIFVVKFYIHNGVKIWIRNLDKYLDPQFGQKFGSALQLLKFPRNPVHSGTQLLKFSLYLVPRNTQFLKFSRYSVPSCAHGYQGTTHADPWSPHCFSMSETSSLIFHYLENLISLRLRHKCRFYKIQKLILTIIFNIDFFFLLFPFFQFFPQPIPSQLIAHVPPISRSVPQEFTMNTTYGLNIFSYYMNE